jgi:hypothetical protein
MCVWPNILTKNGLNNNRVAFARLSGKFTILKPTECEIITFIYQVCSGA